MLKIVKEEAEKIPQNWIFGEMWADYQQVEKAQGRKYAEKFMRAKYNDFFGDK
jgi:quinol monooxygenase YgiN